MTYSNVLRPIQTPLLGVVRPGSIVAFLKNVTKKNATIGPVFCNESRPTLQEVCSLSTVCTRWPYPYLPMQTHVQHEMSLTTLTSGALSGVLAFQTKYKHLPGELAATYCPLKQTSAIMGSWMTPHVKPAARVKRPVDTSSMTTQQLARFGKHLDYH